MGFSRRVAISVHAGCSAAPILVVCVALGPARAVGVMSLMYPLLARDFGRRGPVSRAHDTSTETSDTDKDTCGPSG